MNPVEEGHLEPGLEDEAAILLGLRDGRLLVDEEDRHVARARGHQRQLALGHRLDDPAKDETPRALQRDLELRVAVQRHDGGVLVRRPGPGVPEGRILLGGRLRRRGTVQRRGGASGPGARWSRRIGPVGDPHVEGPGRGSDQHAHPYARRGTPAGDWRRAPRRRPRRGCSRWSRSPRRPRDPPSPRSPARSARGSPPGTSARGGEESDSVRCAASRGSSASGPIKSSRRA